ncbi:hypothetical protein Tco_0867545, partial [Tanacetum coccineum]
MTILRRGVETSLRDDVVVRGSDKPHLEHDIDLKIQVEIDECIAYADALREEGIDARVVVEAVDREEIETGTIGQVEVRVGMVTHPTVPDDIPEPAQKEGAIEVTYETLVDLVQKIHDHTKEIPVHRVQVIEGIQMDQGKIIVATAQQSAVLSKRISELERDNMRLRGTLDVASQKVSRLQRRELRVHREMRQIRPIILCYDVLNLMKMPNIRFGATTTREMVNELIDCRVEEALEACDAARNFEPLVENGGEQGDEN